MLGLWPLSLEMQNREVVLFYAAVICGSTNETLVEVVSLWLQLKDSLGSELWGEAVLGNDFTLVMDKKISPISINKNHFIKYYHVICPAHLPPYLDPPLPNWRYAWTGNPLSYMNSIKNKIKKFLSCK